jgi:hypothetical protein
MRPARFIYAVPNSEREIVRKLERLFRLTSEVPTSMILRILQSSGMFCCIAGSITDPTFRMSLASSEVGVS